MKESIVRIMSGKCHLLRVSNIELNFVVDTSNNSNIIHKKDLIKNIIENSMPISDRDIVLSNTMGIIIGKIKQDLFKRCNTGTFER